MSRKGGRNFIERLRRWDLRVNRKVDGGRKRIRCLRSRKAAFPFGFLLLPDKIRVQCRPLLQVAQPRLLCPAAFERSADSRQGEA